MKNKLYKKLFALSLTLVVALALTACNPVDTNFSGGTSSNQTESSPENEAIASTNPLIASTESKTTQSEQPASKPTTSIDNSEQTNTTDKNDANTPSLSASSEKASSKMTTSENSITKAKAKVIALTDAGLKESQVSDLEIELDRDKGVLHYDVSFEYKGKDYEYEINANTGNIISVDKPNPTDADIKISKAQAKTIALKSAGVTESQIRDYEIELEKENGVWLYEISFEKGNKEYEFVINATTGKILHNTSKTDN